MDIISKAIKEFEDITGEKASKYNLDYVCGFMECYRIFVRGNDNGKEETT